MKLIWILVASFMLFFCMFGIRIALDAGMMRRFRRREHFSSSQLHLQGDSALRVSESLSNHDDSVVKTLTHIAQSFYILVSFFNFESVSVPSPFLKRAPDFLSALLDPPLVPPPKA